MFEIIIRETKDVVKTVGKDWKVCSQAPEGNGIVNVYDYTPEIEKTVAEINEIYKQQCDELDIKAVIKTINNISNY